MDLFAKRLRERARQLELTDAEVARRAGLSERRYGHYVRGARQPDFQTLLRICAALDATPDDSLLANLSSKRPSAHDRWLSRLTTAASALDLDDLKLAQLAQHEGSG
jgi:transcriptional regulator with XRE-family HTH domain